MTANALVLAPEQLDQLNSFHQTDPESGYEEWFAAHGAVDATETHIQFVVEGNRSHPVRVVGIQPVTTCSAPLNGTLFYSPPEGNDLSTQLLVNLDSPNSAPSYIASDPNGNTSSGKDFFGAYTISLTQGQQYTFYVVASTAAHYCTFTLDMTVLDGGRSVVEPVSNNGRPFGVTAMIDSGDPRPGEFAAYRALYIGGVLSPGHLQNKFGDALWATADPSIYFPTG